jgi:hypothetical protein
MESPESATVLAGFLGNGGHPPLHIHDADLFYVVLEGSATVRLGHGHHQAKAGEVIYIPAGYPHGSDNQSGAAEHHLEILTPGVGPGQPFMADVRQQVALSLITGSRTSACSRLVTTARTPSTPSSTRSSPGAPHSRRCVRLR